jgi:CubicO group peptidase (beta-lactamase class C family)
MVDRTWPARAGLLLLLVPIGGCATSGRSAAGGDDPGMGASNAASGAARARADRVEQGLLAPTAVADQPPARHTIAARMAFHGVPAVSIAVIDSGRVAWARAYGVTTPGGAPTTPRRCSRPRRSARRWPR